MMVHSQELVSEKRSPGARLGPRHHRLWWKETLRYYCLFSALTCSATSSNITAVAVQMHKDGRGSGRAMSVEEMVQGMIDALNDALADAGKHDRGNSAAGTRVRKAMQATKNAAQDVRKQVQADKNSR